MAHEAFRVMQSLYDTPHLISQTSLNAIVSYLEDRGNGVRAESDEESPRSTYGYNPDTQIGMLSISGALTNKTTGMEMMCGGVSYQSLEEQAEELLEAGAKTLVQMVDSGGGEAYGCFQTANRIREMADEYGASIISYVDGTAASAAYGLIAKSDKIILNPDAGVGSIGVVIKLQNVAKAKEQAGIQESFVYAGANKIPYAEDGSYRKEFIADLQARVDKMYESFATHVAEGRSLSLEAVKATEAKMFMADEAISLGLADEVMTTHQFANALADMASNVKQERKSTMFDKILGKAKAEDAGVVAELEAKLTQMGEQFAQMEEQFALAKQSLEAHVADAVARAEQAEAVLKAKEEAEQAKAQAAEEARLSARKEKLSAAVGDEKAVEMFEALKALPDAAFDSVVDSMSAAVDQKNAQMDEIGFTVEQASTTPDVPHFSQYLKIKKEDK